MSEQTMGSMFPSTFLKAADVQANPGKFKGLVISEIKMVEIEDRQGVKRIKPALYFSGITQGMVLNKTNRNRIMEKFQMDENTPQKRLIGKEVDLVVESVDSFGDLVDAIRIAV